jgi:hypothetical protein
MALESLSHDGSLLPLPLTPALAVAAALDAQPPSPDADFVQALLRSDELQALLAVWDYFLSHPAAPSCSQQMFVRAEQQGVSQLRPACNGLDARRTVVSALLGGDSKHAPQQQAELLALLADPHMMVGLAG